MSRYLLLFILLLCCGPVYLGAQLPGMHRYTQFEGFTAATGYLIDQDAKGFIWIGTDNGGMYFDGQQFRALQQLRHISDADIISCNPLGNDRTLLVPISNNIRLLDKGKLITSKEDPRLMDTARRDINMLSRDPITGDLWLSNNFGMQVLHRFSGDSFTVYHLPAQGFRFSYVFNNYFIGVGKDRSLQCYSLRTGTFQPLYNENGDKLFNTRTGELLPGDCSRPYIGIIHRNKHQVQLFRYIEGDSVLHPARTVNLQPGLFTPLRILIDNQSRLWLKFYGLGGITYCGYLDQGPQPEPFQLMRSTALNTLFIDRNSNLWMTSRNNSLYFLSQKHFQNALLAANFPQRTETPKSISGDGQGQLLVGYLNVPELVCIHNGKRRHIRLGRAFNEGISRIISLGHGQYLLCSGDVALFDAVRHTVKRLHIPILAKDVCTYEGKDLLVARPNGVFYYATWFDPGGNGAHIFEGRCNVVAVAKGGHILIGTPNGLYIKQGLHRPAIKIAHAALQESYISALRVMADSSVLVGTNARGLYRYAAGGQVFEVQQTDGKPEHIRSLYRQNDSVYWVSSDDGAWRLLFNSGGRLQTATNYTFYDGLPSSNINSVFVSRDTAYLATADGIGIIPLKDSMRLKMAPPEIYLNSVQADSIIFHNPAGQLLLRHNQNELLFNLSAISYESLGKLRYYYRLYPLQEKWILASEQDIRFSQLPPGDYRFQAYALNAKGGRSRKTIDIGISIQPAFWQTFYFKAAVFLLAGAIVFWLLRWWVFSRERNRTEKVQEKKRLAELELEAIKAQINPHFIYNCLNSIQYLNYREEHDLAQQYLDIFARLIRMTMHYSQQAFITLEEEIAYLSAYLQLEKLRFKEKLHYDIFIEPRIMQQTLLPAMLIQPYVENALKYGIAGQGVPGRVDIRFEKQPGSLQITIADNGPGFSTRQGNGSLGLRISGTRAHSYNKLFGLDIRIDLANRQDSDPAVTGALIKITIPQT